jgi:ATP-dependent RNA helicase DeaD
MKTFKEMDLNSELLRSLDDLGFVEPSPIQAKAIPFLLKEKKDLIALAQTGTGKTAAFSLPILQQLNGGLQALILCPTRELCLQISQEIDKYSKYSKEISTVAVYGGDRIDRQIRLLNKGANIVVGTPGRVRDLIQRKALDFKYIKWVVLDEADEMLDMGFKDDLDFILGATPKTRQTLLFSATMSKSIYAITKQYMKDAFEISIGTKNIGAENVSHEYYVVNARERFDALKRILDCFPGFYGILFCRTRRETQEVTDKLQRANYRAEAIHGDVSQNMRTKIMDKFKKKQISLLVATDVAARGIDVNDLSHVVNYSLPEQNEIYTHRSGRTGRAKKSGVSLSLVTPREKRKIKMLEKIIGKSFEYKEVPSKDDIFQKQIDSFIEELEKIDISKIKKEQYFLNAVEKFKKFKKEELIELFIANQIKDNSKDDKDLNAKTDKDIGDSVCLKINIGKKQGFGVKELFSLINSNSKLKGIDIGRIDLMQEYSLFMVGVDYMEEVINSINGIKRKGKKLNATVYSNNHNSNSRGRRNKFNRRKRRR